MSTGAPTASEVSDLSLPPCLGGPEKPGGFARPRTQPREPPGPQPRGRQQAGARSEDEGTVAIPVHQIRSKVLDVMWGQLRDLWFDMILI